MPVGREAGGSVSSAPARPRGRPRRHRQRTGRHLSGWRLARRSVRSYARDTEERRCRAAIVAQETTPSEIAHSSTDVRSAAGTATTHKRAPRRGDALFVTAVIMTRGIARCVEGADHPSRGPDPPACADQRPPRALAGRVAPWECCWPPSCRRRIEPMPKGKGNTCGHCNAQKAHEDPSGAHTRCAACGAVEWDLSRVNFSPGKGKGRKCLYCEGNTVHQTHTFSTNPVVAIFRCSRCTAVTVVSLPAGPA